MTSGRRYSPLAPSRSRSAFRRPDVFGEGPADAATSGTLRAVRFAATRPAGHEKVGGRPARSLTDAEHGPCRVLPALPVRRERDGLDVRPAESPAEARINPDAGAGGTCPRDACRATDGPVIGIEAVPGVADNRPARSGRSDPPPTRCYRMGGGICRFCKAESPGRPRRGTAQRCGVGDGA